MSAIDLDRYLKQTNPEEPDKQATPYPPKGNGSTYRVVFFDLDGTLLPMDLSEFLGTYLKQLTAFAVSKGTSENLFSEALGAGMGAMAKNSSMRTNYDVFWEAFDSVMPESDLDWHAITDEYYINEFGKIGEKVKPNPAAARVVNTLVEKGYPLVLATMPMFPRIAVEWRLKWAGVDPAAFSRITTYDISTAVKPDKRYFAEQLIACGVEAKDVLMVGNNTVEDMSIRDMGAEVYMATDCLLNPANVNLFVMGIPHGTLEQLADWAETLGPCENPATNINSGR